jgi:O-antigen ligase/tetratricopeptide (TPR) repeat protein
MVMALAAARRPIRAVAGLEAAIAPCCAAALLFHPTPLTGPALLLGLLPSAGRWITAGRPWRPTPFDVPLALLVAGGVVGQLVTLDPGGGAIRLAGLASAIILFAWAREHAASPRAAFRVSLTLLAAVALGTVLLIHVAQPFLRLERVPPLALLANALEPLGLYRALVADDDALQRFRLYASGVGALAAVALAMTVGLAMAGFDPRPAGASRQEATVAGRAGRLAKIPDRRPRAELVWLALGGLFFGAVLLVADNRGSMLAAAISLACLVVWWRPRLLLLSALLLFGTLDLIALGMAQRGLSPRTVLERLDFWQKGMLLAAETPLTGVGLGVHSVQLAYRAAFQPANPPFNHTHNIYVQGLLEQGVLGLAGLVLLTIAVLRRGPALGRVPDGRSRAAGLAAMGGTLTLLTAGLTEVVALTTVGGALLAVLLGLLAAARDACPPVPSPAVDAAAGRRSGGSWPGSRAVRELVERATRARSQLFGAERRRRGAVVAAILASCLAVAVLAATGIARPLAAVPFLNVGTSALYVATLPEDVSRGERARALAWATPALQTAGAIDPGSVPARRNLALALAASGDRPGARRLADEARSRADPTDHDARFGVGRAYLAAEAWDDTIATWEQAAAGPQLLRLGRRLNQASDARRTTGLRALTAAARLGAPGRLAPDAIVQAELAHGASVDEAIRQLDPLVASGGMVEYQARLEMARTYRRAQRLDEAQGALTAAEAAGRDPQVELERGLILLWRGLVPEAEPFLAWAASHLLDPSLPVPDGDDPRYWLAVVQARLGRHAEAVRIARAGLAELPSEQASLRVPYYLLLGDSLLALGRPDEALSTYQAGQRIAPGDGQLGEGVARARAALRQ